MRAATRRDGSGRGRHDVRCVPRRRGHDDGGRGAVAAGDACARVLGGAGVPGGLGLVGGAERGRCGGSGRAERGGRVHDRRAGVRCGGAVAFADEPRGDGAGRGRAVHAGHRLRIRDPAESGARRGLCARPVRREGGRRARPPATAAAVPRRGERGIGGVGEQRGFVELRGARASRARFGEEDRGGRRGRARRRGRGGGRRGRRGAAGGRRGRARRRAGQRSEAPCIRARLRPRSVLLHVRARLCIGRHERIGEPAVQKR